MAAGRACATLPVKGGRAMTALWIAVTLAYVIVGALIVVSVGNRMFHQHRH
jgi:hypothetical protein